MSRTFAFLGVAIVAVACHSRSEPTTKGPPAAPKAPRDVEVRPVSRPTGSAVVVAEIDHRHVAVVADDEESAIHVVDLDTRAVVTTKQLEAPPGQIVLTPGGTLFVALRGAARVVALRFREENTLAEVARHDTGDEPYGVALTPDGTNVLVTTIGGSSLEAYRATDLEPVFVAPLPRDPRSIAVTADGKRAFVSHATGSVLSVVDLGSRDLVATDARRTPLDERERRRDFGQSHISKPMPPPHRLHDAFFSVPAPQKAPGVRFTMKRVATQGFALAIVGDKVYLPETLVMTSDNESIPTGYGSIEQSTLGTHVPFIARARLEDEKLENPELSGPADRVCFENRPACIVPRAVTDDGEKLYVACLDSDEVLVVDPADDTEHAPKCQRARNERPRMKVASPTSLAVDTERKSLVVFSSFSRSLTVGPIDRSKEVASTSIPIPRSAPPPAELELVSEGRTLFHRSNEPRIAKNGRACASCHVEGRDDGLVWPTPLGKRQTPMLAGRIDGTAPYGWQGEHASLVLHIKSTVKNLEGTGLPERELEGLAAYVASMRAPARRMRSADAVARGKTIFASNETGCASCHVEDTHFTDRETHTLGKVGTRFDTPSLAFVGQTAPYFHDGRFKTLEDLIEGCDGIMGHTQHLSGDNRRDLAAYLRSL